MLPMAIINRIYAGFSTDRRDLAPLKFKYLANKTAVQGNISKETDKISSTSDSQTRLEATRNLKKWQHVLKNLKDSIKEYYSESAKRQDIEREGRETVEAALQDGRESHVTLAEDVGPGVLPISLQDNLTASILVAAQEKHALYQEQEAKEGFYKNKVGQLFQGQVKAITEQLLALKKSKFFKKILSIVRPIIRIVSTLLAPITFGISTIVGIIVELALSGVEFLVQKGYTNQMKRAGTKQKNSDRDMRDSQRHQLVNDKRDQQRLAAQRQGLQRLEGE